LKRSLRAGFRSIGGIRGGKPRGKKHRASTRSGVTIQGTGKTVWVAGKGQRSFGCLGGEKISLSVPANERALPDYLGRGALRSAQPKSGRRSKTILCRQVPRKKQGKGLSTIEGTGSSGCQRGPACLVVLQKGGRKSVKVNDRGTLGKHGWDHTSPQSGKN